MIQNEFTIVLPSNSSMKYFPTNTTTNFSTRLPREIELYGSWVVGISEIYIPCTTLHLCHEDTKLQYPNILDAKNNKNYTYFKCGTYDSINLLIEAINDALPLDKEKKNALNYFMIKKEDT